MDTNTLTQAVAAYVAVEHDRKAYEASKERLRNVERLLNAASLASRPRVVAFDGKHYLVSGKISDARSKAFELEYRPVEVLSPPALPEHCTGALHWDGRITHDGGTCPVHEA